MTKVERERILADIAEHGRQIISVIDGDPPFAYTIGNRTQGLPELLIIGVDPREPRCLNALSEEMRRRGQRLGNGEIVELSDWSGSWKLINANATAQAEYTVQAGVFYGHDNYPVQQILLQDRSGMLCRTFRGCRRCCRHPQNLLPCQNLARRRSAF